MANTLDDVLAELDKQHTEIVNLKLFVQTLKDKITGVSPEMQAKIDSAIANVKTNTAEITDVINQSSAQL